MECLNISKVHALCRCIHVHVHDQNKKAALVNVFFFVMFVLTSGKPEDQWSCKRSPEICFTGVIFFSESLNFSPTAHFLQDFHLKGHFKSFPHSNALTTYVDLAIK